MGTQEENFAGLAAINRDLIAKAEAIDLPQRVVLAILSVGCLAQTVPTRS